jgi:Spy/CpxP family protein refolding chaperone
MKTQLAFVLVFLITGFFPVQGQAQMEGPPAGVPMTEAGMMQMMRALDRLELSAEQAEELERIKIQHEKAAIPIVGRLRMARIELRELLLTDKADFEEAKKKVKEMYAAQAELEISHIELMQKARAVLAPEQQKEMRLMHLRTPPRLRR